MASPDVALQITITAGDTDAEQFDATTLHLMQELRGVGVESINRATIPTEEGAKTGVAFAPGAIDVSIQPNLIDRLLHILNAWTTRGQQRTVKIETPDGMKIEFTPDKALTPAEMMAFIRALRPTAQKDATQSGGPLSTSQYRFPLRELLVAHFNESELRTLCFYLGITYEDLSGQNLSDRINALVTYIERHKRINDLLRVGQQLRPEVAWQRVVDV